ncbi:MAG: 50S ribosomal protein L32 [Alphaproteobacteria bacterium]|nr:50S ribosomal protein L32 [Alphaproteobacteria bacterium]
MAVPKKRTSKSRKRMRRAHDHIRYSAAAVTCKDCGELRLRHHVCMSCGSYKGQQVLELGDN